MTQYDFNRNALQIMVEFIDLVTRIGNLTLAQATEAKRDAYGFTLSENAPPPDHNPPGAKL